MIKLLSRIRIEMNNNFGVVILSIEEIEHEDKFIAANYTSVRLYFYDIG